MTHFSPPEGLQKSQNALPKARNLHICISFKHRRQNSIQQELKNKDFPTKILWDTKILSKILNFELQKRRNSFILRFWNSKFNFFDNFSCSHRIIVKKSTFSNSYCIEFCLRCLKLIQICNFWAVFVFWFNVIYIHKRSNAPIVEIDNLKIFKIRKLKKPPKPARPQADLSGILRFSYSENV